MICFTFPQVTEGTQSWSKEVLGPSVLNVLPASSIFLTVIFYIPNKSAGFLMQPVGTLSPAGAGWKIIGNRHGKECRHDYYESESRPIYRPLGLPIIFLIHWLYGGILGRNNLHIYSKDPKNYNILPLLVATTLVLLLLKMWLSNNILVHSPLECPLKATNWSFFKSMAFVSKLLSNTGLSAI